MKCLYCDFELIFEDDGRYPGWKHVTPEGNSLYIMWCKSCGYTGGQKRLADGTLDTHCPRCGSEAYVDDHVATPKIK